MKTSSWSRSKSSKLNKHLKRKRNQKTQENLIRNFRKTNVFPLKCGMLMIYQELNQSKHLRNSIGYYQVYREKHTLSMSV